MNVNETLLSFSTPTKNSLPPSGLVGNSNAESRLSQPKGVVGGVSIFGNAGPDFMASMKERSSSLSKVGSNGALNGITGKSEGGDPPKKRSFGKGTPAPAQPKPKAPSLPSESSKPAEHRSSRNLSSGGRFIIYHSLLPSGFCVKSVHPSNVFAYHLKRKFRQQYQGQSGSLYG